MSSMLRKQHKVMYANTTIFHLKELYSEQSCVDRYSNSNQLYQWKMKKKKSSISAHKKIIIYIEKLYQLGSVMDHGLSIKLVLQFQLESYLQFIKNSEINNLECTLPKLLNMRKTIEHNIKWEF